MSILMVGMVKRRLVDVVQARMVSEPVVIAEGPRTVGKSTLLQEIAAGHNAPVIDLDDLATRDAVRSDPALFVGGPPPVFIDEFQHVPEVLDQVKAELNLDASPGRFVITGSTSYATRPQAAQSLTGRAHRVMVRPLSQGEIAGTWETFAERLITDPSLLVTSASSRTLRADYVSRVVAGGFPLALRRKDPQARSRWFDDYVVMLIERDLLELSRVRQRAQLPRLLERLASQTGGVLNIARAAEAISMEKSTAENYTTLLAAVFLIEELPAWGVTLGSKVARLPKMHIVDSGLGARILRLTEAKLAARNPASLTEFGHLLETFVVGEVRKQLGWIDQPTAVGHWRTRGGEEEVDMVVEREDGRVAAVEVKAGSRVLDSELRSLRRLRGRLGHEFLGGVVLYTGSRSYTPEERIHVLPLDVLWS